MSWLFSRALVEEYSAATCSDGAPSAPLSVMPTPHRFWHNGKTMDASQLSRFGLTCAVLTEDHGEALLTWCLEASHAKTSAAPERERGWTVNAQGFGVKCLGLLAKLDPASSSWKIPQCSLLEDSESSLETWPRWGSMHAGECWELTTLAARTAVKGSGLLLPTPSGCRSGKNHVVGRLDEWGGKGNPWRGTEIGRMRSPAFEEWVMGWPVQWTVLTAFEMDRYQQWQLQHSLSCPNKMAA